MSQPEADMIVAADAVDQLSEILFNANQALTDYEKKQLSFDGVNVNIEIKQPDYNEGSTAIVFINIVFL